MAGTTPKTKSLWRKVVTRSLALLGLGFATSIAVAWTFAVVRPAPQYPRTIIGVVGKWDYAWQIAASRKPGQMQVWWMRYDESKSNVDEAVMLLRANLRNLQDRTVIESPPTWGSFRFPEAPPQPDHGAPPTGFRNPTEFLGSDDAFGWPFLCLWDQSLGVTFGNRTGWEELHGAWLIRGEPSVRYRDFIALPLWPIWLGLAQNTLFYAIAWSVLLWLPATIRRSRRARRGWCPKCGYDVQHQFTRGCPECGWRRTQ